MAAKIIILPRDRLAWHAQMLWDLRLSHTDFRVGVCIGTYFNNRTGKTFVGFDRIAEDLGLDRASVARSIASLKKHKHLHVDSGGGRHIANEYRMQLKTVAPVRRNNDAETVANGAQNRRTGATTTLPVSLTGKQDSSKLTFVAEESADAQAWSASLRSQGKSGTLLITTHEGKRGAWMPSARPPGQVGDDQDEEKKRSGDAGRFDPFTDRLSRMKLERRGT